MPWERGSSSEDAARCSSTARASGPGQLRSPAPAGTAAQRASAHGRPRPAWRKEPRGAWRPLPRSAGTPNPALPRLPAVRGELGDVAAPPLVPQRPGTECTAGPPPTSGPGTLHVGPRGLRTRVRVPSSGHRARRGSQEQATVPGARLASQHVASLTFRRRRRRRTAEVRWTCAADRQPRRRMWAGPR